MNQKILLDTVEYLSKKQNPDEEDLKNEKSAWSQLIEMGIKKEEEFPERVKEKVITKSGTKSRSKSKEDNHSESKGIKSITKTKRATKKAANPK